MALKLRYEDKMGTVHPEAYARIGRRIHESKLDGSESVCVEVSIYASQAAREAGKRPVWGPQAVEVEQLAAVQPETKEGQPPPEPIMECAVDVDRATTADGYTFLKTLDKFKEATDA